MAETRTTRGSSFWVWATIVIVLASILAAWFMTRDDGENETVIPPVETGATP